MMICHPEYLSKCENIVLEAKRVLLNEQLDKMADIALSDHRLLPDNALVPQTYTTIKCLQTISVSDTDENALPTQFFEYSLNLDQNTFCTLKPTNINLIKKYFERWKQVTKIAQSDRNQVHDKLEKLIVNLKEHQKPTSPKSECSSTGSKTSRTARKFQGSFKNRYKSQKNIIDMQRSKIEEQNKIINELKLGIIREDLLKSIENTKVDIREIFSNCSERLLCKAPLLQAIDDRDRMMICAQKAPKMVQRMQQRAIERAKYREIILERKRLIEETRQKLLEEAIEKKRVLEEEERKRNLEIINEQRRKEMHLQKVRQEKKQQYEMKLSLAIQFHNKLLIKQCFRKLFLYYFKTKENETLARAFLLRKQTSQAFKAWFGYVEAKYEIKYEIADAHFRLKIARSAIDAWKEYKLESLRSWQVAEDLYDFRLANNTFVNWHRFVCKQIMIETKRMQISINHNNRRLLFQYFYQWKSLPMVLQLEKAKEEKKRKWREKVWEILPDYQPPENL